MTATDNDYAALLAAIDAGDDSAIPALADLLEERGSLERAWHLRHYAQSFDAPRPRPVAQGRWALGRIRQVFGWSRLGLSMNLFKALRKTGRHAFDDVIAGVEHLIYDRRSDAFLAVAEALVAPKANLVHEVK